METKTANMLSFMKLVEQHGEITELTAEAVRMFVEKIIVHEAVCDSPYKRWANKTQELEVFLL